MPFTCVIHWYTYCSSIFITFSIHVIICCKFSRGCRYEINTCLEIMFAASTTLFLITIDGWYIACLTFGLLSIVESVAVNNSRDQRCEGHHVWYCLCRSPFLIECHFRVCIASCYIETNFRMFNTLKPSDAYIRHFTVSSLVQMMACRLLGAKSFPESKITYC